MNNELSNSSVKKDNPASHVTSAPENIPGENFDPKIRTQLANEPDVVHAPHRPESVDLSVSDVNRRRHEESVARYPHLNLSDAEFIVLDVKRHPIGLTLPVLSTAGAILAVIAVMIFYPSRDQGGLISLPPFSQVVLPMFMLMLLIGIGGAVAVWVYLQNHFYMTNESVIQEIQTSLFSRNEQTVSLGSIEDASFRQSGIMQMMFNYGTVRLSTEGEETTYRFSYVANPRAHIAVLNNAIEAFKNGRRVDPYES